MKTKYGNIPDEMVKAYVHGMSGKVYKILPMKEENVSTLSKYIKAILREFIDAKEVVYIFKDNQNYLAVIATLESLLKQNDMDIFRSDFFKAMTLIDKMKQFVDGEPK